MKFIDNENIYDPTINLSIEEYALSELDPNETYLLFYVNEPSIIIGKNQNTIEEINADYVEKNHIHVVRRLSGGGAVYHDHGNLNFSFITKDDGNSFHNFAKFTKPVIQALQSIGINAELCGRNDIVVQGRKISGNAQFVTKGRMFSHGTLLLDSQIDDVVQALNVKLDKIQSKGIKSIRSRVANINEFLEKKLTMDEFKQLLLQAIFNTNDIQTYTLSKQDFENINAISNKRYRNWDWNYGKSPKCNVQHVKRFPIGQIDIRFEVNHGLIETCKIFGDFFGTEDVSNLENLFCGLRYDKKDIRQKLNGIDVSDYFGAITTDDVVSMIFS